MTDKATGMIAFNCPRCGSPSAADGLHVAELPGGWIDGWPLRVRFYVVGCQSCGEVAFGCREEVGPNGQWDDFHVLWPPDRPLSTAIPTGLRESFGDARKCFKSKYYSPAAVMIRRTLEGVCVENGLPGKNLKADLDTLLKGGTIDARLHEWGQELRVLGNEGAHYSNAVVKKVDVDDALAFTEALLDYIYVLTARFHAFKKRRARSTTSP